MTGRWPANESEWGELRAYFDEVGQSSLEEVVAKGVPPEVAGRRIAEFNDTLIERLKKKAAEEGGG